jgi:hypothetical protein
VKRVGGLFQGGQTGFAVAVAESLQRRPAILLRSFPHQLFV